MAATRNEQTDHTAELASQRETITRFADGLNDLSRSAGLPSGSEELFERVLAELADRGEDSAQTLEQPCPATNTDDPLDMRSYDLITARPKRTRPALNLSVFLAPRLSNETILLCLAIYLAMIAIYMFGLAKSNGSGAALNLGVGTKTASASAQVEAGASSPKAGQVPQVHIAPPYVSKLNPSSRTGLLQY